jgi:CHAT domain-containing protein
VELGPIEPIEAAVERWRQALGVVEAPSRGVRIDPRPESDPHARGVDLRRLIFDPLLTQLAGVERIVVALDDVLHLVPLDALPANGVDDLGHGPAEPLLGDLLHVELRLGLFELLQEDEPVQGGGSLVVFGDVDYGREGDGPSDDPSGPASRAVERAGILRGSVWEAGFGRLSGTGVEARGIESILRGSAANATAIELRTGAAASRANLLELAPKARYLHVATHGWFAPDSIRSHDDPAPRDERLDLAPRTDGAERARGMSPMLLCGLALSGANLPEGPTGRVPGLVTAEELATLDLAGCELAVLSACDTNVGQRRAGQGVASLQRAMHMAGARSVITSLWKVPDEATTELMLEFYRRLWVEKQSKAEALWEAKSTIRRARDAHGVPRYTTRDWAAWVLTGEPR